MLITGLLPKILEKVLTEILTSLLSDCNTLRSCISVLSTPSKSSYWKLNSGILKHNDVTAEIKRIISQYRHKALNENVYVYGNNGELF